MSQEYSCPKCAGKTKNKGSFTPRYFILKDKSEVGYVYHSVVDNQGRLRQHTIGVKAPQRITKSDISTKTPYLDISKQELDFIIKKLPTARKSRQKNLANILEKILKLYS